MALRHVAYGALMRLLNVYWRLRGGRDVWAMEDLRAFFAARRLRCVDMYLQEQAAFPGPDYSGPCCLLPERTDARNPLG